MKESFSVVIPVHNESEAVAELSRQLVEVLGKYTTDFELVFVDDASTDGTLARLLELREEQKYPIRIVELSVNQGQTAALAAGIDAAAKEIIVTMDGDLQHSPYDLPAFIDALDTSTDLVIGWRKVRTDGLILRRIPSKIANALMRHVSGMTLQDFGTAYRVGRAPVLKQLELFGDLHRFVPVLVARAGGRIKEIPISVHPRETGHSKYGLSRTFGVVQDLLFLEFYLNYLTKPIRAFGKIAFICFGLGATICAVLVLLVLFGVISSVLRHEALLLFAVLLIIIGVQLLATGILAELLSRILHRTAGKKIYSVRREH